MKTQEERLRRRIAKCDRRIKAEKNAEEEAAIKERLTAILAHLKTMKPGPYGGRVT